MNLLYGIAGLIIPYTYINKDTFAGTRLHLLRKGCMRNTVSRISAVCVVSITRRWRNFREAAFILLFKGVLRGCGKRKEILASGTESPDDWVPVKGEKEKTMR